MNLKQLIQKIEELANNAVALNPNFPALAPLTKEFCNFLDNNCKIDYAEFIITTAQELDILHAYLTFFLNEEQKCIEYDFSRNEFPDYTNKGILENTYNYQFKLHTRNLISKWIILNAGQNIIQNFSKMLINLSKSIVD